MKVKKERIKKRKEKPTRIDRDKGTRRRKKWGREGQTEEEECVLTGDRIIDVPSGDRLPPCCLFYFLFLSPRHLSLHWNFSSFLTFSPSLAIDTLVTDSATQPSGRLNERNLITAGKLRFEYATLARTSPSPPAITEWIDEPFGSVIAFHGTFLAASRFYSHE